MKKFYNKFQFYIFPIILILILSFSRLIPHPSNFTPILAVGIFAGFYFQNFILSFFIVIFSMFLGDLYLGFHSTMFFTYSALLVSVLTGYLIKNFKFFEIFISGLISSLSFFIITNFGAWLTLAMYEKSLSDLIKSYVLAIPFFHNTLISTFLYLIALKLFINFLHNRKIIKATI